MVRKLSKYNLHMKREMRKGKTFKQAVSSWRGTSKSSVKKSKTRTRSVKKMAKKRKVRRRKSSGFDKGLMGLGVGAVAYGYGREYVSDKLQSVTANIPLLSGIGNVGDEVVMAVFSYALAKGKIPYISKFPITRQIGKAGFVIEASRLGQKMLPSMNVTTAVKSNGGLF
jgi:hypothetical protein